MNEGVTRREMNSEIPGQIKLSDEELGIKVPARSLDVETHVRPEKAPKIELENTASVYRMAKESMVPDPNPKNEDQIDIISLLSREMSGGFYASQMKGQLAHIVKGRFETPEEIRALSQAVEEHYVSEIDKSIERLRRDQEDLPDQNEDNYNPRRHSENQRIFKAIEDLEEEKKLRERTKSQITYLLTTLADIIERHQPKGS